MHAPPDVPDPAGRVTEILFPRPLYLNVFGHVVRKLTGHYVPGETAEPKAFGVLGGRGNGAAIEVTAVYPLQVNARHDARRAGVMNTLVEAHAIPSETPNTRRGWVADPGELLTIDRLCDRHDWMMFGNYHTHRVPWPDDPLRDHCTGLDRVLADGSGQWVFIVSAVDLRQLSVRAFYEGDNDREAVIRLIPEQRRRSL